MHVKTVELKNFKRFADLTISDLPIDSQLVVLTGPNGSGKSAIAEAFNYMRRTQGGFGISQDPKYFNKTGEDGSHGASPNVKIDFHEGQPNGQDWKASIYVRSAYRHQADFNATQIGRMQSLVDDPGQNRLVEIEQRVQANYQRLVARSVADLYDISNDDVVGKEIRERIVGKLQELMVEIFGDLVFESPGNPFDDGTFLFTKGNSTKFRYPNLSAGEKAAFDLILDFVLATEIFDNAVYWLDEPELHLGSRVQGKLLAAFLKHLPEGCQLWVATHSLGMMRTARSLAQTEGKVSFLDTSGLNLDEECSLTPVVPDRKFWRRVLEIALDDMAALVAPEVVYLCEGNDADNGFDAVCYRVIFSQSHPEAEFVSVGDSNAVKKGGHGVADAIEVVAEGTTVLRVVDRDDHTDAEIADERAKGVHVLRRRTLETYLLSDELLAKLCSSVGKADAFDDLKQTRDEAVAQSGAPSDDYKKARQAVHTFARNQLAVPHPGQSATTFLQEVMAPLVTPDTSTYIELREVLFGD